MSRRRRTPPNPLPAEPYWDTVPGSRGFLQSIAEEPEDDGLRLVFADWLEDHGQPQRAEFIRVQVRRTQVEWDDPEQRDLETREDELLKAHRADWLQGLPKCEGVKWKFERGLLERAEVSWSGALDRMRAVFAAFDVRHLHLSHNEFADEGAATLAASPHLANLTSLDMGHNQIGDAGATALAVSPHLANLTSLGLADNPISEYGRTALMNSPHLRNCQIDL